MKTTTQCASIHIPQQGATNIIWQLRRKLFNLLMLCQTFYCSILLLAIKIWTLPIFTDQSQITLDAQNVYVKQWQNE